MKMKKIEKVAVIGLGYVGLPLLVSIYKTRKYKVVGFDVNKPKIDQIKNGISPIEDETTVKCVKRKKLPVTSNESLLRGCDVFIVCVPTPIFYDYTPNYDPLKSAALLVKKYLTKGCHVVIESTVNPGTCEEIVIPILNEKSKLKAGIDFNVSHCPERINPGDPKWTVLNINRNIGSINREWNIMVADFYRSFVKEAMINEVSCLKVAEATKIVENTFRDVNIAYVNELAMSFDAMGIDLHETLKASSNKPFAFMTHWPGCGVGGHCIAVDPYYLIQRASLSGFDHRFLKVARDINNKMPDYTVNRLISTLKDKKIPIKGTKVALLGLSYKANVGDLRESPALEIEKILKEKGFEVTVYDPYVINRGAKSLKEAIDDTAAVVIATGHKKIIDELPKLLRKSSVKVIVDGRNCLNKEKIEKLKIAYKGIGR